jgi:hypothetical protein
MKEICLEKVNEQFNEELQRQIDGTLPKGHVYQLGKPGNALLAAGMVNLPIELSAERLAYKASLNYKSKHPFDIAEVKNLPKAINKPIAVFKSTKVNDNSKIILTELKDKRGNHFLAVIRVRRSNEENILDVNSIASIYPKDRAIDIFSWFMSGMKSGKKKLTLWLDEKKVRNFVLSQPSNVIAEEHKEDLIINIINNFQNSKALSEKT